MKELIAKRYVKALSQTVDLKTMEACLSALNEVSKGFSLEKFKNILTSPDVSDTEKENLVLDILGKQDEKLINFIKVLSAHQRLELIPEVCKEIASFIAATNKSYNGTIITGSEIDPATVAKLQESFSKRVDASVAFTQKVEEFDGVKLVVEDLGMEIGFSRSRLKNDITEHILKAI